MTRTILTALVLIASYKSSFAAEDKAAIDAAHAINTVCPVTGKKIDPKVAPEVVQLTKPATAIAIGLCSEKCRAIVEKDPDTYAKAAIANKKSE